MKKEEQSETTKFPSNDLREYREGALDMLQSVHVSFFSTTGLFKDHDFVDMYDVAEMLEEHKQFVLNTFK